MNQPIINFYDKIEHFVVKAEACLEEAQKPGDTKNLAFSAQYVKIGTMTINGARFLDAKSQLNADGTRKAVV